MKHFSRYFILLTWGIVATSIMQGCKSQQLVNSAEVNIGGEYCAPTVQYNYNPGTAPLKNTDSLLAVYPAMPVHEVVIANAIGVLAYVNKLKETQQDTTGEKRLKRLELQAAIQQRILSASVAIDAIAAELDCEGERADQLAGFLDNYNNKRTTKLTVASIALGAVTTIATVAIKRDGLQNTVAIGGGLLSAGIGALTINSSHKKIKLLYSRNLLADIWYAPGRSSIYPPSIWYVLNEKHFSNSGTVSLIQSIKKRWLEINLEKDLSSSDEELYFGKGGVFKADDLHSRAAMLNELQSTIRSINQDLQGLQLYIAAQQ